MKIKEIFVFIILCLTFECAYGFQSGFSEFNNESCQLNHDTPSIKLNFSQKLSEKNEQKVEKNEFLVAWDYLGEHKYYHTQKPEIGGEILIVRCLPPGHYVVVAKGGVDKLNGSMIEAHVTAVNYENIILGKSTQELVESRNLVWRPMVGDEVFPVYKQIEKIVLALPKFQFSNNSLFVKQGDGGYSLDLSEEGQNILREKFGKLKNRNGRLLVEGFILTTGNRDKLRTESLMRAQTVSTFLIREFSLVPSQVVPIGYGNDWIQTGMQSVSSHYSQDLEEGIILKMLQE